MIQVSNPRAFVSSRPLIHKHVKISVDEWIMETTRPHKHVHIFLPCIIISHLYLFEIIERSDSS